MKASRLGILAFGLLLCGSVLAQQSDKGNIVGKDSYGRRAKAVDMTGKVSNDGNTFAEGRSQRVCFIKNVEMLKGYEGQEVVIRAKTALDAHVIQIISIKRQVSYRANWGDSAFRR